MNAENPAAIPAEKPRGRPRSEQSRKAILKAAGRLLREQGLRAMTIEAVADHAAVSKATIYRWWSSKGVLALDAFYSEWAAAQGLTRDTGTLRGELRSRLRTNVRLLTSDPLGSTVAELIAEAQSDPELAQALREHVQEPLRDQSRAIFKRAVERGEIRADADIEAAIDLFHGPLYFRFLLGHAPLSQRFADAIVEMALDGLGAGAARAGRAGRAGAASSGRRRRATP